MFSPNIFLPNIGKHFLFTKKVKEKRIHKLATIQSRGSTSFSFLKDPFPHATLLLIIWYYCLSLSLSLRKRTLFFSLHDLFFLSTSEVYRKTWDQGGTNTFVFQTSTVPLDKRGSPSPSCLISFYFLDKKHDSLSPF